MGLFDTLFGRGSSDAKLQDSIFNLKFTAKTLARTAKKCEAEEKANKTKVRCGRYVGFLARCRRKVDTCTMIDD